MNNEIRVGPWLARRDLNLVSNGDKALEIEPKVMDVLFYLAEHAGEVISKNEIIRAIWLDTCVSEEVLTYSIFEIRRTFADDARNPRFIQTIPRRGYRLIAPVTGVDNKGEEHVEKTARDRRGRAWFGSPALWSAAALCTVLAGVILLYNRMAGPGEAISIIVLPFENLGSAAQGDPFAEGLTDELITGLGTLRPALSVISRIEAMHYGNGSKSLLEIGRELNVRYVLEGTVRHEGPHIRVSTRLVQVSNQSSVWAASYDRELGSALEIESDIAKNVVNNIRNTLSASRKRGSTGDPAAATSAS